MASQLPRPFLAAAALRSRGAAAVTTSWASSPSPSLSLSLSPTKIATGSSSKIIASNRRRSRQSQPQLQPQQPQQQHHQQHHHRQQRRAYHSYEHSPPPGPFNAVETAILAAALPHVAAHGFTAAALGRGATDAGYGDAAAANLFSNRSGSGGGGGAFSLVHYHLREQRARLAGRRESLRREEEEEDNGDEGRERRQKMGVGAKVRWLTVERLMGNREVIHRWQEALALMALPSNLPTALSELHALADDIWFLADDVAVDASWYSKRAALSAVYAAAELAMTTDTSPGHRDTVAFLDRRLRDSAALGAAVGNLGQWAAFTARAGVNVLRSKGVRI